MSDTLPSLQEVIDHFGLRAKKSFGQHFLLDPHITDEITRRAGVNEAMEVIEVGPGPGGLTRSLLASPAKRVIVIEKDTRCVPVMEQLKDYADAERMVIHMGDALEVDPCEHSVAPRAIIANLPYNVGTKMLLQWLKQWHANSEAYSHITVMLQQEVVERIIAKPGTKEYGRLAVMSQWLCHLQQLMHVPPEAFTPPPKVDSGVIQLTPRERTDDVPFEKMERVVQTAFNQRRKMLRKALSPLGGDVVALCEKAGVKETLRPDQLTVENYIALARLA